MEKELTRYNQAQRDRAQKRAREIVKLRHAGKTWPEIGEKYGISPQRAWQLYGWITQVRNVE